MAAALTAPAPDGLEAAVSGGPVERLLAALGWDGFDPLAVGPEFRVGSGRVDDALRSAACKAAGPDFGRDEMASFKR